MRYIPNHVSCTIILCVLWVFNSFAFGNNSNSKTKLENPGQKLDQRFSGGYTSDAEHFWLLRKTKQHLINQSGKEKGDAYQLFHRHTSDPNGVLRPGPKLSFKQILNHGMSSDNGQFWFMLPEPVTKKTKSDSKDKKALIYQIQALESGIPDATGNTRWQFGPLTLKPELTFPASSEIHAFQVHASRGYVLFEKPYAMQAGHRTGWYDIDLPKALNERSYEQCWLIMHMRDNENVSGYKPDIAAYQREHQTIDLFRQMISEGEEKWHSQSYELETFISRLNVEQTINWQINKVFSTSNQVVVTLLGYEQSSNNPSVISYFVLRPNGKSILIGHYEINVLFPGKPAHATVQSYPHKNGMHVFLTSEKQHIQSVTINLRGEVIETTTELKQQNALPFGRMMTLGTVFITLLFTSATMIILWRRDPNWNQTKLPSSMMIADLPSRLLAACIDVLPAASIICFATGTPPQALIQNLPIDAGLNDLTRILPGLMTCGLYIIYASICESVMNGQTIGKRIWRLRVTQTNGQPASFVSCLLRNVLKLLEFIAPPLLMIAVFNPTRQRLGDMLAQTLVVHFDDKESVRDNDSQDANENDDTREI